MRMLSPGERIAWLDVFSELRRGVVLTRTRWCLGRRSSRLSLICLPEEQFRRLALRRTRDVCRRSASVTRQSICPIGKSQSGQQGLLTCAAVRSIMPWRMREVALPALVVSGQKPPWNSLPG